MRARVRLAAVLAAMGTALGLVAVSVASSNPVVAAMQKTSLAHSSVGRLTAVSTVPGVGKVSMVGKLEAQGNNAHVSVNVSASVTRWR